MIKNITLAIALALSIGSVQAKPKEKVRVQHVCTSKDSPEDSLACLIYREARGEGETGMKLIANVVNNRVKSSKYSNLTNKVIFQKGQFTHSRSRLKVTDQKSWILAKQLAKKQLSCMKGDGICKDRIYGATFFYTGSKPYWAKGMTVTLKYKKHTFLKEKH